jgi:hypothetical protein
LFDCGHRAIPDLRVAGERVGSGWVELVSGVGSRRWEI